ncbi:hypothetical protein jhhlp_008177 [Lomentospora prolificans]|uniref:Isochorismatase-like domain-containing protein n=1 Tax=Lomentospora prolificans TaxID=41688 RepID=A0A2N3MZQ1_9PEZI|nr:hypothetical protein jhhlp_008177 [Lomentospora prolificans]
MSSGIALLVIDIQNKLATAPQTRIPRCEEIRAAVSAILAPLRAPTSRKCNNCGWLVSKTVRNAFESNTALPRRLRAAGVDHIIAFGIQSECCVVETCKGAIAAGFGVTLLSGAHSMYDGRGKLVIEIEHEVEAELRDLGAQVIGWRGWLASLNKSELKAEI